MGLGVENGSFSCVGEGGEAGEGYTEGWKG